MVQVRSQKKGRYCRAEMLTSVRFCSYDTICACPCIIAALVHAIYVPSHTLKKATFVWSLPIPAYALASALSNKVPIHNMHIVTFVG